MMPKISNGASFGGIVNYANDLKDKDTKILASRGIDLRSNYTITQSFKLQAKMNPRVEKCVGHFSLSFPPEDSSRCTDGFMRKLAMEFMSKMGITNTQFVMFRHNDRDHDHVHVVYNRVSDSGKTISDGCDVERAIAICQAMTRQYGLHWSDGKRNVDRSRLKGKAIVKYAIYDTAQKVLAGSHTWSDFIRRMSEHGIRVTLSPRENGKGMGIVFTKDNISMSGYQVDRRSLTFDILNERLDLVNAVLPRDQWMLEHVTYRPEEENQNQESRQTGSSYVNPDDFFEDRSVNIYDNTRGSDFLDTDAIAEAASDVASAAAQIAMGPTVVPTADGGGGSGNKSSWRDDDEDEKEKKKRRGFHR